LFGPVWRKWAREFIHELHGSGLVGRVIWKISCRADAVDPELFAEMQAAGLYFVYMGLESGTEEGLRILHKQITVEQNLRAVAILKKLDLPFQFGFMLFEPSSTFESVRENLAFLHAIVDDGGVAVTFCRMIPYDGTPIKDELVRAGRLKGDVCQPGYDFLDPRLDRFYDALTRVVDLTGWVQLRLAVPSNQPGVDRSRRPRAALSASRRHAGVQRGAARAHPGQQRRPVPDRRGHGQGVLRRQCQPLVESIARRGMPPVPRASRRDEEWVHAPPPG
jgi:hypothetical protein